MDSAKQAPKAKSEHYSYSHYAKEGVAENFDRDRYGFPFGDIVQKKEIENFEALLSSGGRVLDVGAGTGKLFIAFAQRNMDVKGVDASLPMLSRLRRKCGEMVNGKVFVADAHNLPFADKAFDGIVSSRVMMHLFDWKGALKEFCRVSGREIVVDFPPLSGFSFLVPLMNPFKRIYRGETYTVFSVSSVKRELEKNHFWVVESKRMFFLPIGVHRRLNNARLSETLENFFEKIGLTRLFGGPVIIKAQRSAD